MKIYLLLFLFSFFTILKSQTFTRSVIDVPVDLGWDIELEGEYLYFNEMPGKISRVNLSTEQKEFVYQIEDISLFPNDQEKLELCPDKNVGTGYFGMDLDPEFSTNPDRAYIYCFYAYNSGTEEEIESKFKIIRIKWAEATKEVVETTTILDNIDNGFEHFGGRLIATKENTETYIYFTLGDLATTSRDCYESVEEDPIFEVQNINTPNGKVHRIKWDGSIPEDNPIQGSSLWSFGLRNPQGITSNSENGNIYTCEHGPATDDEVNIIMKGMNYGWPNVSGYHDDNIEGEMEFIDSYQSTEEIGNDRLIEPIHSWCAEEIGVGGLACTIAPGAIRYYGSDGIPKWKNSLLVSNLKYGNFVNRGVWVLKLNEDGTQLIESTEENPNPVQYFTEDQFLNGRIRDFAISDDGKTLYLINFLGDPDVEYDASIIKYTFGPIASVFDKQIDILYPNPANDIINIGIDNTELLEIYDISGNLVLSKKYPANSFNISGLNNGLYIAKLKSGKDQKVVKFLKH